AWGAIGYQGAIKRSPMASVWYAKSANAPLSNPGYEWRTRAALLAGNWPMVRWSIEQMPPSLRNDPAWIYWHARALKQSGARAPFVARVRQRRVRRFRIPDRCHRRALDRALVADRAPRDRLFLLGERRRDRRQHPGGGIRIVARHAAERDQRE
ncbi:hypothetical protein QM326_40370, partial [Burkholderia cenocepacia]|nr:hypothetical protein [Burkholderia cenocepacia]